MLILQMEFKKITLTIPENILEKYKHYCNENGMNVSKKVAILMRNDLNENEKKMRDDKGQMKNENKIN